jgi:hypothetical protein
MTATIGRVCSVFGVEPAIVVFVVIGPNGIDGWQIIEEHPQRFGCRLQLRVPSGIIAVGKSIWLREERRIKITVGIAGALDRDDQPGSLRLT